MEYFSFGEMMPTLLCLRQQLLKVEVNEDKRLEMDVKMFVRRKNEVVGKLDLAVEVLTTAFGVELDDIVLQDHLCFLVLVMVPQAMHACCGSVTEATRHVMIFGAIMELHVPSDRDKQHHESHQK